MKEKDNEEYTNILKENVIEFEKFKNTTISCAVIGLSGSGKSTLINTILGQNICDTGVTETTSEVCGPFAKNGLSFFDLPGCGTIKFPIQDYVERMDLLKFDCLILVTSNRFYENDLTLLKILSENKKHVFIVRTKIDQSIDDGKHNKPRKDEIEILNQCIYDIEQYLQEIRIKGIFLISSRYPDRWDFGKLLTSIEQSLGGFKKDKFISEILTANEEILRKKIIVAKKIIRGHSSASALNGLNPILGLDISVDLAIVLKMNKEIISVFSLDDESIDFLSGIESISKLALTIKTFTKSVLTKEILLISLKKLGPQVVGKQIVKYVPLIGQVLSVGASFGLTYYIGNETLKQSEAIAREVLENLSKEYC